LVEIFFLDFFFFFLFFKKINELEGLIPGRPPPKNPAGKGPVELTFGPGVRGGRDRG
jgi:hypothetical protein